MTTSSANNPIERPANGADAFASLDHVSFSSRKLLGEHSDLSAALSVLLGREPLLFGEPVRTKFYIGSDRDSAREIELLPYVDYVDTDTGRKLAVGVFAAGQDAEARELHVRPLVAGSDAVAALRAMWIVSALESVSAIDLDLVAAAAHAESADAFFKKFCTSSLEVSTTSVHEIFSRPVLAVAELIFDMGVEANIRPARTPLLLAAQKGLLSIDPVWQTLPPEVQALIDELPGVRNPSEGSAELLSQLAGLNRRAIVGPLLSYLSRARGETVAEQKLRHELSELTLDLRIQHERFLQMGLIGLCEDDRKGGTASEQIIASELATELRKVDRFMRTLCAAEGLDANLDLPRAVRLLGELEKSFVSALLVAEELKKQASSGPKAREDGSEGETRLREHVSSSLQGLYASFNRARREFLPGRYSNIPDAVAQEGMAVR